MFQIALRVIHVLATEGVRAAALKTRKTLRYQQRLRREQQFDKWFGTDTCGHIELDELSISGNNQEHGVHYEPTPTGMFQCMLTALSLDFSKFDFVDLGSGKGKTLLLASSYPFQRITGVEFAEELHEIANHNIMIYESRSQKCKDIQSLNMDVMNFEFPRRNLLIYFFNPFDEVVMGVVLARLARSLEEHPRQVVPLYYNPRLDIASDHGVLSFRGEIPLPKCSGCAATWRAFVYSTQEDVGERQRVWGPGQNSTPLSNMAWQLRHAVQRVRWER